MVLKATMHSAVSSPPPPPIDSHRIQERTEGLHTNEKNVWLLNRVSCYIVQAGLELMYLPPQPPKSLNSRCVLHPFHASFSRVLAVVCDSKSELTSQCSIALANSCGLSGTNIATKHRPNHNL